MVAKPYEEGKITRSLDMGGTFEYPTSIYVSFIPHDISSKGVAKGKKCLKKAFGLTSEKRKASTELQNNNIEQSANQYDQ
ncbi:unnamed protein product, partial [Thlaspi arvense]